MMDLPAFLSLSKQSAKLSSSEVSAFQLASLALCLAQEGGVLGVPGIEVLERLAIRPGSWGRVDELDGEVWG